MTVLWSLCATDYIRIRQKVMENKGKQPTLRPSGGSLVSLMQACRRLMGSGRSNEGGGSALRNSLVGWWSYKGVVVVQRAFADSHGHSTTHTAATVDTHTAHT